MQSGIYHLLTLYMVPSGFLVGVFVCQWVCVCVCVCVWVVGGGGGWGGVVGGGGGGGAVGGNVVDLNVPEHFQCTLFKLQIE